MSQTRKLQELKEMITSIERTLFAARSIVSELSGEAPLLKSESFINNMASPSPLSRTRGENGLGVRSIGGEEKIIEGAFNGQGMTDSEGNTYPVPVNYASKSKIVVGDRMKLTITTEGRFLYKQIAPTQRRNAIGPLTCEDGQYKVLSGGKEYKILTASITFHKASIGDEVSVLLPQEGDVEWGAFDVIIPKAELES